MQFRHARDSEYVTTIINKCGQMENKNYKLGVLKNEKSARMNHLNVKYSHR